MCGDLAVVSAFSSLEEIAISSGGLAGGFSAFFPSVFLGFCAVPGRDSVFSGEGLFGGFSEVEHLLHDFWVLSGGLSSASLPVFDSFRCGDQP